MPLDFGGLSSVCAKLEPASSTSNKIIEINILQKFKGENQDKGWTKVVYYWGVGALLGTRHLSKFR